MQFASLKELVGSKVLATIKGPVAIIIAEDAVEVVSTIRHHFARGFKTILFFAPPELDLQDPDAGDVIRVDFPTLQQGATAEIVNAVNTALPPKTWFFYCYNAEYLFFPFCETRTIGEMLTFQSEERRDTMLTYVIDVYAGDLGDAPDAVSLDVAHLDRSGYYALSRKKDEQTKERQLDFYGGLRWRFEEHIEETRRKIDRISLVRARRDAVFAEDHTWSVDEMNTYACPWHHNLTAAVMSFRTAKALRTNAASRFDINSFKWHNSIPFEWQSQQLMDLGLMEPGQWF